MELRLDDDGTQALFGYHDENLRMLEDEFGVKISSRGHEIFVQGTAENIAPVEKLLNEMQELIADTKHDLLAKLPHGTGQTLLREALVLADHNSYHLGQLMFLRKMLEA